jgi:hypothetical protein
MSGYLQRLLRRAHGDPPPGTVRPAPAGGALGAAAPRPDLVDDFVEVVEEAPAAAPPAVALAAPALPPVGDAGRQSWRELAGTRDASSPPVARPASARPAGRETASPARQDPVAPSPGVSTSAERVLPSSRADQAGDDRRQVDRTASGERIPSRRPAPAARRDSAEDAPEPRTPSRRREVPSPPPPVTREEGESGTPRDRLVREPGTPAQRDEPVCPPRPAEPPVLRPAAPAAVEPPPQRRRDEPRLVIGTLKIDVLPAPPAPAPPRARGSSPDPARRSAPPTAPPGSQRFGLGQV